MTELKSSTETEQIEMLSSLFFTIEQIAIILNVENIDEFKREILYNTKSPKYIAYKKGSFTTQISLRMDQLEFAKAGSNAAIETMKNYFVEQKLNENT